MQVAEETAAGGWIRGAVALALVGLVAVASGCWSSASAPTTAQLKEKQPERPFEELRVFTEPNERSSYDPQAKVDQRINLAAKPGHWTGVLVQGRANLFDFEGVLSTTPQDSQQRPVDLEQTSFWLSTTRGVTLPKAQRKTFETLFFAPRPPADSPVQGSTWIANALSGVRGGQTLDRVPEMVSHMPSFQYFMVVLAKEPVRYQFLNQIGSVRPALEHHPVNVLDAYYYRVQFPPVNQPLALPTQSLCWTSTAVVLWDNVLPTALSPDQQRAMLDWLHWGGTLVVSGPDSLDKLRGSFLEGVLPAGGETAGPIDTAKLAELHSTWSVSGDESAALGSRPNAGWSGIELSKHRGAEFISGSGGLVAAKSVGRGRVVITAFRLNEPELLFWPSFDSFFHAALLGRPPREFDADEQTFAYVGENPPDPLDANVVTGLRYLTRDAREPVRPGEATEITHYSNSDLSGPRTLGSDPIDQLKGVPGTAGWNDFSWISSTARQTLQEAAGISVPQRQFVLKMIGLYLLVIVPLNWLVFRLAGRVEWAWIAVPVVAIVWGVLVVWLAQLDIGFARAQIEVDVLEVQPNYARGHLTRYAALYSSLSSQYELRFEDTSAVALPFSTDRERLAGQASSGVTLTSVGERDLSDFQVASNSTGMIHGEQMLDLGGEIVWEPAGDSAAELAWKLDNRSKLKLSGAAILRRRMVNDKPVDEVAWLGDVAAGATVAPTFVPYDPAALDQHRDAAPLTAEPTADGTLSLRRLADCVENYESLAPGEVRLVGWMDGTLGKLQVSPATAQMREATLVVVHLHFDPVEPVKDKNLRPHSRLVPEDAIQTKRPHSLRFR